MLKKFNSLLSDFKLVQHGVRKRKNLKIKILLETSDLFFARSLWSSSWQMWRYEFDGSSVFKKNWIFILEIMQRCLYSDYQICARHFVLIRNELFFSRRNYFGSSEKINLTHRLIHRDMYNYPIKLMRESVEFYLF